MLNAYLLWFLPLVALPVLLHLLSLRRIKTVDLSTYRFLMEGYVQQRRRVKLLEFLLMFLRTLFVLLIVLTLSRPVVDRFGFLFRGKSGRDVVILLDAGASMSLREGPTTSFDRGRAAARAIVELLGAEDHLTLIRAGQQPRIVAQRFAINRRQILQALDDLAPEPTTCDMGAALKSAADVARRGARVVYAISDCSRSGWASVPGGEFQSRMAPEDRLVVMNVGPTTPIRNLGLTGTPPPPLQPVVGLPVVLTATLANGSGEQARDTVLTTIVDGEQIGQMNLSLQPGERAVRAVPFTPRRAGVLQGQFRLPPDPFPEDDTFLFCLNVQPRIDVALIVPPPDGTPRERPQTYLRAALESPMESGKALSLDEQQLAKALSISFIPPASVSAQTLQPAAVVVLADAPLDEAALLALRRYVETGGGLIIFPGPRTDVALLSTVLANEKAFGAPAAPWPRLDRPTGSLDDEAGFLGVGSVLTRHPVLSVFEERDAEFFHTVRVYRHYPVTLPSPPAPASAAAPLASVAQAPVPSDAPASAGPVALLRLENRVPLLVEASIGRGRAFLAGIPATPDWSSLPLKPEFVPLLLRSVAYLRRSAEAEVTPSVRPYRPAVIQINGDWMEARVQAEGPDGKPHGVELHRSGDILTGATSETGRKGYYRFRVTPRTPGAPEELELGFAVNLDAADAEISRQGKDQILAAVAPLKAVYLEGNPDDPLLTAQLTQRREIWRTLIWITFAVIGLEFFLSTLRTRHRSRSASAPQDWLQRVDALGGLPPGGQTAPAESGT
jgi:hypothetical protein